ncbi:MAG: 30S ribosomal protein S6 [Chlamydiia bacterium]|nr:30S ribosomal protein S6 [Chlamydiia bacterium]
MDNMDTINAIDTLNTEEVKEVKEIKEKLYEIMIVVDTAIDETRVGSTMEKIASDIGEYGGDLKKSFLWGKRHLAYQIRGRRDGQYFLLYATLSDGFNFKKFERRLVLDDKVLRHAIFRTEKVLDSISFKPLSNKKNQREGS